jgi:hypothetical protein
LQYIYIYIERERSEWAELDGYFGDMRCS